MSPCKKGARNRTKARELDELRNRISALDEAAVFGAASDLPPEIERKFLESVIAFETAREEPLIRHLRGIGHDPPPPDALSPQELATALWKLIEAMAKLGVYLHHTDHLSDLELYRYLWHEQLPEPIAIVEGDPGAWHIDPVIGGSEESIRLWLTYYADAADRHSWTREFPGEPLPESRVPPYQRDALLPRPDGWKRL